MPVRASPSEGPIAATVVALAALTAAWSGLYEGVRWPHVAGICIVAALPALATAWPRPRGRRAAAVVATLVAVPILLAMALRHSVWDYVTFDGEAWRDARAVLPDGLRSASDAGLPVSFGEHPEMVGLLDLALAALAATIAWQLIARRRPVAALLALGVGLAYRWTVEPPDNGVLAGAFALAAVAAILALAAWDGGSGERAARRARGGAGARRGGGGRRGRARRRPGAGRRAVVGVEDLAGRRRRLRGGIGARPAPAVRRARLAHDAARGPDGRLREQPAAARRRARGLRRRGVPARRPRRPERRADGADRRPRHRARPGPRQRRHPALGAGHAGGRQLAGAADLGAAAAHRGALRGDGPRGRRRRAGGGAARAGRRLRRPHGAAAAAPGGARRRAGLRRGGAAGRLHPAARRLRQRPGRHPGLGQRRPRPRRLRARSLRAGARPGPQRRRRRPDRVRRGQPGRVVPAQGVHLRRGAALSRPACPTAPPARPTGRRSSTSSSSAGAASASTSPGRWR